MVDSPQTFSPSMRLGARKEVFFFGVCAWDSGHIALKPGGIVVFVPITVKGIIVNRTEIIISGYFKPYMYRVDVCGRVCCDAIDFLCSRFTMLRRPT